MVKKKKKLNTILKNHLSLHPVKKQHLVVIKIYVFLSAIFTEFVWAYLIIHICR